MRRMFAVALVVGALAIPMSELPVHAAGCLKGAVIGGAAGHLAGHHGLLGAGAGCAIGHHEASRQAREQQQQAGGDIGHGSEGH